MMGGLAQCVICQKQKEMLRPPGIEPESSTATIWRAYHYTTGAVPPARIELASSLYEGVVLPLNYGGCVSCRVLLRGIEPRSSAYHTDVLPLNYRS